MPSSMTAASIVTPLLEHSAENRPLRTLLAMRQDHPAASPRLARALGASQIVAQRIKLGHEAVGSGLRFTSARDAIEQSGYRVVHSVAVACVVVDGLALEDSWPEHAAFWTWAFTHATIASILAEAAKRHEDAAFSATLLRNVGHLLIERSHPEARVVIREHVFRGASHVEAEQTTLGFTHLDVMRELADGWGLDEGVMPVFDEQPERGSVGRVFWKAKRSLHREGVHDAFDPIDLPPEPLDLELHELILASGGIRGVLSWSAGYIASAFLHGDVADTFPVESIAPHVTENRSQDDEEHSAVA